MANKTDPVHMQSMWAFILGRHRFMQVRLLVLAVVLTLSALAPIHFTRLIIDDAIPARDRHWLAIYIGLLIGALLIALVLTRLQTIWTRRLEEAYTFDLRKALLRHLVYMPQQFFNRQSTGALQAKVVNEVMSFGAGIQWILVTPFISTATAIIYTAYIFSISSKLALLALLPMPLLFFYANQASKRLGNQRIQCSKHLGDYSGKVSQVLESSLEIQLHGTADAEMARLNDRHDRMSHAEIKESTIASTVMSASQIGKDGIPIMIIGYGAVLAMADGMSIGAIIAFLGALAGLLGAFERFMSFLPVAEGVRSRYQEAHNLLVEPNLDRDLQGEEEAPGLPVDVTAGSDIELHNVTYKIEGARLLLSKINVAVGKGTHVALIGRSGCGKSTLLQLLTGRLVPSDGTVLLQGLRFDKLSDRERVKRLGYVGQTAVLFPETVRFNLVYGYAEASADRAGNAGAGDAPKLPSDEEMIAVCEEVGLGRDLLTLGLQRRVDAQTGRRFEHIKARLAVACRQSGYVSAYTDSAYLSTKPIVQNLVFAPLDLSRLDDGRFAAALYEACRTKDNALLGMLLKLGKERIDAVVSLGATVKEMNPNLLKYIGLQSGEETAQVLAAQIPAGVPLDRKNREALLQLFREGVRGTTSDPSLQERIIGVRTAVRSMLCTTLPAAFSQDAWHEGMTVFDNLVAGDYDPENVTHIRALQQILESTLAEDGLSIHVKALGLDSEVGEKGSKLSGGQRQKIALARVMLRKLPVILLDEVTASLDQGSASAVNAYLRNCKEQTMIAVTHDLDSLPNFDRVIVLDRGEIIADGVPQSIMENQALMKSVFGRH